MVHAEGNGRTEHKSLAAAVKEKRKTLVEILPAPAKASLRSHNHGPLSRHGPTPAKLDIDVLSPPLVFHGNAQNSTGALLGGEIHLTVLQSAPLKLYSLEMQLVATTTTKKPVSGSCSACSTQTHTIFKWTFLQPPPPPPPLPPQQQQQQQPSAPTASSGTLYGTEHRHTFPFSYLLPGHLAQSSGGRLGSVSYSLVATATPSPSLSAAAPTSSGGRSPVTTAVDASPPVSPLSKENSSKSEPQTAKPITATRPLTVSRALPRPQSDRNSQRVFPPTSIRTTLTHPPVIHPTGSFNCYLRLSGLAAPPSSSSASAQYRWRLKRLTWRLEEHARIVSPACPKHLAKVGGAGQGNGGVGSGRGMGILHVDARDVGTGELKAGWKTDWSEGEGDGTGMVECEFEVAPGRGMKWGDDKEKEKESKHAVVCDIESPTGLAVTHKICLELIVAEEVMHRKKGEEGELGMGPNGWSATGSARVLRTQHAIVVTERSGLGVSWDEEMPPVYEDVPGSPPGYVGRGEVLGQEEVANLEGIARIDLEE